MAINKRVDTTMKALRWIRGAGAATLLTAACLGLLIAACDTTDLDVQNPNEPTPEVLQTEAGLQRAAEGFYEAFDLAEPKNFAWIVQAYHEFMGDALVSPWGNWQFRWISQVARVMLDDGSVVLPPQGGAQALEIARVNNREQDVESAVVQEWASMYFLNNQANLVLETLDAGTVTFSGDAAAKEAGYRAWAHFWKGYAYARIGSMYEQGLVLDVFGQTQSAYVNPAEVIAESNRQFDLAIDHAASFDAVRDDVVPALFIDAEVSGPTAASLQQAAHTLKARNLLVNTRRDAMTAADWEQVRALTQQGLQSNDGTFILRGDNGVTYPDAIFNIFINYAAWGPRGWHRVSERLIQDIQPGDARLAEFEQTLDGNGNPETWSTRGRGIQYNSTWRLPTLSRYSSESATEGPIKWYFVSFEENLLMQAEALLALGDAAGAAALVDQVRTAQGAGLPAVDAGGDVWEQIRSERRIGLFLRGLAFYDARRYGLIDPLGQGGGRTGAVVVGNDNTIYRNATIDYSFLPYWPVPDEELTFNRPGGGGPGGNPR